MSTLELPCPQPFTSSGSLGIVASLFNQEYTDALIQACTEELKLLAPRTQINIIRVPGAFEVPVAIRAMVSSLTPPDVVVAFGLIIRGGTEHGDLIGTSVTNALQDLSITYGIPAINQVLLVNNESQAFERCMGDKLNRGREGARAAVSMLHTRQELLSLYPHAK